MSTAGPAWVDSSRTRRGAGAHPGRRPRNSPAADSPLIFTDPQSLSFGDLPLTTGAPADLSHVALSDAGGGGRVAVQ